MSSRARLGRTICLVLGVLSLAASMAGLFRQVDARDGDPADTICGGVTNPREGLSPGCAVALQAHAQATILPAVAGVGWMLGAVAFGLIDRQQAASASAHPAYPAAPAAAGPPPPGPAQWSGHGAAQWSGHGAWPH